MPRLSTSGLIDSKTSFDIWLNITPLILFSVNPRNPSRMARFDTLAPLLLISSMTGASSFLETSWELASVPVALLPS